MNEKKLKNKPFWRKKYCYGTTDYNIYNTFQHHIGIRLIKAISMMFRLNTSVGEVGVYFWKIPESEIGDTID